MSRDLYSSRVEQKPGSGLRCLWRRTCQGHWAGFQSVPLCDGWQRTCYRCMWGTLRRGTVIAGIAPARMTENSARWRSAVCGCGHGPILQILVSDTNNQERLYEVHFTGKIEAARLHWGSELLSNIAWWLSCWTLNASAWWRNGTWCCWRWANRTKTKMKIYIYVVHIFNHSQQNGLAQVLT